VTGSSIALNGICIATLTGVGGVTVLGTGGGVNVRNVVVNVLLIAGLYVNVEGNVEEVAAYRTVAAPVVLGSIPLKVEVTAGILKVVYAVALVLENPLIVLTGSVKGGIACCKSELIAIKSSEGVRTVIVYSYYPDLVVGCIRKIVCGVINALVIEGSCGNLKSGEELAVAGVTNKNVVAGLKLGCECPAALCGSYVLSLTSNTLTIDKLVAKSVKFVSLGIITVCTGEDNNALLGAGRLNGNFVYVVGKRVAGSRKNFLANVATSLTGLGMKSVGGTGCLYGNLIIVVTKSEDGGVSLVAALGTSDNVSALFGTGRFAFKYGLAPYVVNAGVAGLSFAALTLTIGEGMSMNEIGIGLTALALAFNEGMLVEKVANAGDLTENVLSNVTRSESEKYYRDRKSNQRQSFDFFHFFVILSKKFLT
jgi:hypothetical protein